MTERKIKVKVERDHLSKISATKPINALAELIWNSMDADATVVRVTFHQGELGVDEITITDNGVGFSHLDAEKFFGSLGDSWKSRVRVTKTKNRYLHGKDGEGRFKAFSLGQVVNWYVYFSREDKVEHFTIRGHQSSLEEFRISPPQETTVLATGVKVVITEIHKQFNFLSADIAIERLAPIFASYIANYSDIELEIGGIRLDPSTLIKERALYGILGGYDSAGKSIACELEIIEWDKQFSSEVYFCGENGIPLQKCQGTVRGTGDRSFTAYMKSPLFETLHKAGQEISGNLDAEVKQLVDLSYAKIRTHFVEKKLSESSALLAKWKTEKVYPYVDEPKTPIEDAERKVFDILALNLHESLPTFDAAEKKAQAFHLTMLKHAVERSPEELRKIFGEVLGLSQAKQLELAQLLEETSLDSIISVSRTVTDRLKFVAGLEEVIFNPELKKTVLERSQLHRLLAKNTWIFGDAYSLSVNDKSLSEVLRKHLEIIGSSTIVDEPVKRADGSIGIVDLMLTRSIPRNHATEKEHLIIELKAPRVKIDRKEIIQVEEYAFAIAKDERFRHLKTRWCVWVISNDIGDYAKERINQDGFSDGIIYKSAKNKDTDVTIVVKTWSEIISECKHRLEFVRSQLNYNIDGEQGFAFLKERYSQYLEKVGDSGNIS